MLDRLVGLETEYVLRFRRRGHARRRIANADLFALFLNHVRKEVPVAAAIVGQNCWFLGNGGGLRYEFLPYYHLLPASGFIEGATPECRGPAQVLRYQRAQDVLLSRHAAAAAKNAGEAVLLKCSHDGHGHVFGSHENYEATIATGAGLWLWRIGLAPLLIVLFFLLLAAEMATLFTVSLLSVPVMLVCGMLGREPGQLYANAVGWLVFLGRLPAQVIGSVFMSLTAFRRVRRELLPFLITRTIFTGPGLVCPDGRFLLSPRANTLHSLCGITASGWRSVYYFCHILKGINDLLTGDSHGLARLFAQRQRLQITLGDSNMSQHAEYLKIGTTLLVLDVIEAGGLRHAPRLRWPLRALRTIAADPDLQATVRLADGRYQTALAIQRYYYEACRRYVAEFGPTHEEANGVLDLWGQTLDALEQNPELLVGKLDWVTKRHLLATAGADAPLEAKRKLDMRYHELSPAGYYLRLEAAGVAPTLAEPEQVLDAIHTPPSNTPAALRGQLIHQFARDSLGVRASWSSIIVPSAKGMRLIALQ